MKTGSREWHWAQIEAYRGEFPFYEIYANALRQVLERACQEYGLSAIVQVRPKSLSSFAEKAMRKVGRYDDPAHQLTDLCGARVITQTQAEAEQICAFIKGNFRVDEANSLDVGARLRVSEFGYLSVHYVVQMKGEAILGVPVPKEIGDRKAEIQVRTLLQHAWADFIHDRVYKSPFKVPVPWVREAARLAAELEDADADFARFAEGFDAYTLHYGAYMTRKRMQAEIETLETLLENEPDPAKRPGIALRSARIAKAAGDWKRVVERLSDFVKTDGRERPAILLELGRALCRVHRGQPSGEGYQKGQEYLRQVARLDERDPGRAPSGPGGPDQTRAEALSALAWSYGEVRGQEETARDLYRRAYLCAPSNPYHLASYLEYEIHSRRDAGFLEPMRPALLNAITACRAHADAGIELPWAFFTMGRFHLLLGQPHESLAAYAKAVQICIREGGSAPEDILEGELAFLGHLHPATPLPEGHAWVQRLLLVGKAARSGGASEESLVFRKGAFLGPVFVVAGGAGGMTAEEVQQYQTYLLRAFEGFGGTVICGGTRSGIAGIIGAVAEEVFEKEGRGARAVGYLPRDTPPSASRDPRYNELVETEGDDFTPLEPLQYWMDLIAAGVKPSEVRLLGVNGGRIAAFEFRLALALGATVGVVASSGRAVPDLVQDPDWWDAKNLLSLPPDAMTLRAFVQPGASPLNPDLLDRAAQAVHVRYLEDNRHVQPDPSMLPWEKLREDFKDSNRHQAAYAEAILRKAGYGIRPAQGEGASPEFTDEEVELMAEMEHGRWVVERLQEGWRYGSRRDPEKKVSPYLVAANFLGCYFR